MEQAGVEVLDRLGVHGGRWFALDCDEPCCPAEGAPLPEPADVPAVAEFVALGAAPLSTRGALASLVAVDEAIAGPVGAELRRRATGGARAGGMSEGHRRAALAVWREVLDLSAEGPPVEDTTPAQVAQLVDEPDRRPAAGRPHRVVVPRHAAVGRPRRRAGRGGARRAAGAACGPTRPPAPPGWSPAAGCWSGCSGWRAPSPTGTPRRS